MIDSVPLEILFSFVILFAYAIFWGSVFIILYHLTRFGIGVQPKRLAAVFFAGAIILFSLSVFLYTKVDFNSLLK